MRRWLKRRCLEVPKRNDVAVRGITGSFDKLKGSVGSKRHSTTEDLERETGGSSSTCL